MPGDEIQILEDHLSRATRNFWEEFYRSRYIDNCDQKVVGFVSAESLASEDTCNSNVSKVCVPEINTLNGFEWARRPTGIIDERFIHVNCRVADLVRISDLGLDMLDMARIEMAAEDDNQPFLDEGIQLYDVILGDPKQNIRFGELENHLMDHVYSYGGYDPKVLKREMGTQMVWRNAYSVRYDNGAARFFPDIAYNDALTEPYDPNNSETWPRLRRVFPWKPVKIASTDGQTSWGIKHVRNPDYIYAPFVINTIFSRMVISSLSVPTAASIGKARVGGHDTRMSHDGQAKWINPDWPCNIYGNKGFFTLGFAAAIKPEYTEYGWAFLTRMDHRITLIGNPCALTQAACASRLSAYCYEGLAGGDAALNGTPGANLAIPRDNFSYAQGFNNGW
jgi:hypothetical protein